MEKIISDTVQTYHAAREADLAVFDAGLLSKDVITSISSKK